MIRISVIKPDGSIFACADGETQVSLPVERVYEEGDRIAFSFTEKHAWYVLSPDDALGESQVYAVGDLTYTIPFGEKKRSCSPKIFSGDRHLITARKADEWEISAYRNLALNPMDQHENTGCFPHASANVETRGESVFAARNAIDGFTANHSHGEWPYSSWGINRDPGAALKLDFGREVLTDMVELTLRADFPHDAWWEQATIRFSDGSELVAELKKTDQGQRFSFPEKKISWLVLEKLIKADDPSPFPALTQIKVFGRDITE